MTANLPSNLRILYAFQGTGNGHASRARELVPIFKRYAQVDVLCSGLNSQLDLNFKIDYQRQGISFSYNKSGGLDYGRSIRKARFLRFNKEIKQLDLSDYDLVINDFEPVSAFAARRQKVPSLGLSHQGAFTTPKSPRPNKSNAFAEWVFKRYAPCNSYQAFHFKAYDDFIHPPIIRKEIRSLKTSNQGYYLVYLPAFSEDFLKERLSRIDTKRWLVFSKECKQEYHFQNLSIKPIGSQAFVDALANCEGLLCSAGFEAPAEALFLGKKLFVIPIKGQYEQDCNAAALAEFGVPKGRDLNDDDLEELRRWTNSELVYPEVDLCDPEQLIPQILSAYAK